MDGIRGRQPGIATEQAPARIKVREPRHVEKHQSPRETKGFEAVAGRSDRFGQLDQL